MLGRLVFISSASGSRRLAELRLAVKTVFLATQKSRGFHPPTSPQFMATHWSTSLSRDGTSERGVQFLGPTQARGAPEAGLQQRPGGERPWDQRWIRGRWIRRERAVLRPPKMRFQRGGAPKFGGD